MNCYGQGIRNMIAIQKAFIISLILLQFPDVVPKMRVQGLHHPIIVLMQFLLNQNIPRSSAARNVFSGHRDIVLQ